MRKNAIKKRENHKQWSYSSDHSRTSPLKEMHLLGTSSARRQLIKTSMKTKYLNYLSKYAPQCLTKGVKRTQHLLISHDSLIPSYLFLVLTYTTTQHTVIHIFYCFPCSC